MRYLVIICILFLQFANSFTAAAEAALPVKEVSQNKKAACLYANDLLHDQAAEVVRSIHFNCIAFKTREHRDTEGLLSPDHQSDDMAGDLRKLINDAAISHWTPLVRLLLFPNHYFW